MNLALLADARQPARLVQDQQLRPADAATQRDAASLGNVLVGGRLRRFRGAVEVIDLGVGRHLPKMGHVLACQALAAEHGQAQAGDGSTIVGVANEPGGMPGLNGSN